MLINYMHSVIVSGLGFGIMSGAFALINILADSVGPGTVGLRRDGDSPLFFVTSAITTLCFILLHTSWNVTFFYGVDKRNYVLVACVVVSHLAASLLVSINILSEFLLMMKQGFEKVFFVYLQTLLNRHHLYWASIPPNYLILIVSVYLAFRTAGGVLKYEDLRRPPVTLNVAD